MLQIRKKILVGLLCAAMVISTSQSVAWSETVEVSSETSAADGATAEAESDAAATSEAVAEGTAEAGESGEAASEEEDLSITEDEALAQCELYAETDQLELWVNNSTGAFAVKVKSNGYCWWSNPYNVNADPVANNSKKEALQSSLIINTVKVTDTESQKTLVRSFKDSVKKGDMQIEKVENGFKATYTFSNEGITIPYYITLDGDHFTASIAVDEIQEAEQRGDGTATESSRSIVDVNLLQDLGSASTDDTGYIITPDGSGAIINFNNGKTNASEYTQKLYGRDLSISQDMAPSKTEQAYLPIMGIVKENNALLEVVTEGSAYATARATVSGQNSTSYNSAWFSLSLRSTDTYYMGGSNASSLNSYELSLIPENRISVSYYPIAKEGVSYVEVAQRYQQYLTEAMGVEKKTESGSAPFYLDIYGGTIKQQSIAGFPVSLETAATTYEQAKTIIESFANNGIDDMIIVYNDFNTAGITSRVSSSVDYSGTLGGKSKFEQLRQYISGIGATLVPSVDVQEYERSGNGYSKTGASALAVTKAYATQGAYELAFGTPHDTRTSWYILSPSFYSKVFDEVISSYTKEGLTAISVDDATNILYSDFNTNTSKKMSRQQALETLKECFQKINTSGLTFVAGAANDYALPYVDYLTDVPLYSSNFDLYDGDIPFYEIVIHGLIPYTTKAKNASSSASELLLYSIATGTPLHYEVMYQDPNKFTDCEYDDLFYTNYAGWVETASNEYKLVKEYVSGLSDKTITDFEWVSKNVAQSTFSDGTVIYADLDNLVLKINGEEINLANYGVKGATTD